MPVTLFSNILMMKPFREVRGGDRNGLRRLCLQIDTDPNLYRNLDNNNSTQTNTILSMSLNVNIAIHVPATCVTNSFPNLSPKPNNAKSTPRALFTRSTPNPHLTMTLTPTLKYFHVNSRLEPIVELVQ